MAEQPENQPISDEERATWVREQFQKANKFLAENGVLFDSVITRNDVRRLKPSPESLHLASKALKVNPDSVLFIGDSFDDIGAARAAGMKCCFIKGGQDIVHLEYPYKPIIIINSFEELINN